MVGAGFIPDAATNALFIDAGQKAYNQLTADKVSKRDLVVNFRKAEPGEDAGRSSGGSRCCEAARASLRTSGRPTPRWWSESGSASGPGLFAEGKLLYGQGGLRLDRLGEEA